MAIQRWSPFNELREMQEMMDRVWNGFSGARTDGFESWALPLDVVESGDHVVVQASLPGMRPEDINVTVEDDVLTIKGQTQAEHERRNGDYLLQERRYGTFYRSLRLPDSVDANNAESTYENGVLTITFPKVEAKKAKDLKVNAGHKAIESGSAADS